MTFWEYLDRRDARRATKVTDARLLANVIGAFLITGFLGALFALFIVPIPKENEQIVTYMIGQLSGFVGGVIAYHYTLTAGAKELDAKRAETTAKAFEAVTETARANRRADDPAAGTLRSGDNVILTAEEPPRD